MMSRLAGMCRRLKPSHPQALILRYIIHATVTQAQNSKSALEPRRVVLELSYLGISTHTWSVGGSAMAHVLYICSGDPCRSVDHPGGLGLLVVLPVASADSLVLG
ncbi:hypothetical protein BO94DRAFT_224819 [Aspergillus sclerotioniger CBS 115572]|uniref:Uncharacterized protein n=1 Tax=Aspergillus sclerotioniger CBS 115572 TaxID=1450535 RepID=A0A317XA92_9EURO|nr:hypothetical protein BO94DRAFT_224819 [Aspergillus sclerotioniger CBS 115572]PWY95315.1 hypothetical protein BO94DRAFT_224819 [Aspergillus sclerotioniger CBS 115572]